MNMKNENWDFLCLVLEWSGGGGRNEEGRDGFWGGGVLSG